MHFSLLIFSITFNVPMWCVSFCTLPRWHGTKGFKYLPIALGWKVVLMTAYRPQFHHRPLYARERLVYYSPLYHTIRRCIKERK